MSRGNVGPLNSLKNPPHVQKKINIKIK
jgi:hypothetical protein